MSYLVLDIETVAGSPDEAETWMRQAWSPSKTWKAATIGERYLETLAKKETQLGLLDSAPILSVALVGDAWPLMLAHWMPQAIQLPGVAAATLADERTLLTWLADVLRALPDDVPLCGHNILHFDLPKLRRRMLVCGVLLPRSLVERDWPVYDTMREWGRFTLDDRPYVPLVECLEACGLPNHKQLVDGSHVQTLYDQQRWTELAMYAVADVLAERELLLRMTGQAAGTPAAAPVAVPGPVPPVPQPAPQEAVQSLLAKYSEMCA